MIKPAECRILLVDDEEGIRFTLGCLLKNEGYLVDVAAGHVDAIVCLQVGSTRLCHCRISLSRCCDCAADLTLSIHFNVQSGAWVLQ